MIEALYSLEGDLFLHNNLQFVFEVVSIPSEQSQVSNAKRGHLLQTFGTIERGHLLETFLVPLKGANYCK